MTRYFELTDDMLIPKRWHLSEVITSSGDEPRLRAGILFADPSQVLRADIGKVGRPLDYSMTSFAIPVARASLAEAIETVAKRDLQRLPVHISGNFGFEVLNCVRVVQCVDESRSEFTKWTEQDHRRDLTGQFRMVTKLRISSDQVPEDAHFFRAESWLIALIVSERVRIAMEAAGCLGAKFVEVT